MIVELRSLWGTAPWTSVACMCKTQVLKMTNYLMKSLARLANASPLLLMRSMEASLECSAGLLRARHVSTHVIICIRCAARGSCEIFTSAFDVGCSGISSYNTRKQLQHMETTTTHGNNNYNIWHQQLEHMASTTTTHSNSYNIRQQLEHTASATTTHSINNYNTQYQQIQRTVSATTNTASTTRTYGISKYNARHQQLQHTVSANTTHGINYNIWHQLQHTASTTTYGINYNIQHQLQHSINN